MNQLTQRLLLFFLGIPLLIVIIIFLPYYHHLAWNIVLILGSAAGARELHRLFAGAPGVLLGKIPLAGAYLPVSAYLEMTGIAPAGFMEIILTASAGIFFTREIFLKQDTDLKGSLTRMAASVAVILYPGMFMVYAVRISMLPDASYLIMLFLALVFTNDSMAFVMGSLFGRKSSKPFKVSPNKSVVGFIGGTLFTIIAGILFQAAFPGALPIPVLWVVVLAFVVSTAANTGDLIESVMKRSAEVKDSGKLMPGRGGILDSLDSILFSAPFFYYILKITLQ